MLAAVCWASSISRRARMAGACRSRLARSVVSRVISWISTCRYCGPSSPPLRFTTNGGSSARYWAGAGSFGLAASAAAASATAARLELQYQPPPAAQATSTATRVMTSGSLPLSREAGALPAVGLRGVLSAAVATRRSPVDCRRFDASGVPRRWRGFDAAVDGRWPEAGQGDRDPRGGGRRDQQAPDVRAFETHPFPGAGKRAHPAVAGDRAISGSAATAGWRTGPGDPHGAVAWEFGREWPAPQGGHGPWVWGVGGTSPAGTGCVSRRDRNAGSGAGERLVRRRRRAGRVAGSQGRAWPEPFRRRQHRLPRPGCRLRPGRGRRRGHGPR